MNKLSFVLYESVHKQTEILERKLGKETAYDFINAVINFGLYGELPDEDSDVWLYGFEQTITSISAAKDRYEAAIENGKKGGRPKKIDEEEAIKLKGQGLKNREIAEKLGCSESSIEKINAKTRKNQKNLNDNVNVNVNDNVNVNENKNENKKQLNFPSENSLALEDSKMSNVKYIYSKPIEEEDAAAARIQKQINNTNREQWLEQLYYGVDFEELANAKTFEERKKALGF